MANAPVVIPYALTELATGFVLNASVTTAQTVFTCPVGMKAFPMFLVFRDAAAAINAATTTSAGNSASATAYLNASALIENMLTSTGPIFQPVYGSSVGSAVAYMQGASNFTITFGGTLTSNTNLKVDVLGYLTAI